MTLRADPILTTDHPIAPCVDLRATFAGEYRFGWDPAYLAERSDFRAVEGAWLTRIPCRFGFIAPHGGRRLAAYSIARRRALAALPGVAVAQGGAGCPEALVTFDVGMIGAVADLLGARRPRRVSPEARARIREAGRAYRFPPRRPAQGATSGV